MKHIWALIIKLVMIFAVLLVILSWFNDYPVGPTFGLAILLTGLSYLIGDLAILPMTNNIIATIADVGIHTLAIWIIGPFIMGAFIPFSVAILTSVIAGVGEWFYHQYMAKVVLPDADRRGEPAT